MTAKEQAVEDIQNELEAKNMAFIAFRSELDDIMDELVNEYIDAQEHHTSYCLSCWSLNDVYYED